MTIPVASDRLSEQPATTLLQMTGGLILHQCLYAAAKLGIADLLKDRAAGPAELAGSLQVDKEALYRVLRVLSGQGVFEETPTAHSLNASDQMCPDRFVLCSLCAAALTR